MTSLVAGNSCVRASFLEEVPAAVYVHVPFCLHRCGYCDFTLIAGRDDLIPHYLQALEVELKGAFKDSTIPLPMDTIYLGGGTPTQLDVGALTSLLDLLAKYFSLSPVGEFTIEANPVGLTAEKLAVLRNFGVNRVSLGLQAFSPEILKLLERDHTPDDLITLLPNVFGSFANVSLDLIFGVPGMSLELWRETLDQALAYRPQHLSTYCLTIEKGTSFWTRQHHGEMMQLENELEVEMYELTYEILTAHGYEHYEVSSYALPGYRSRHNTLYWQAKPYYAFGPGASRFLAGQRETNDRSVTRYIKQLIQDGYCKVERDELPLSERILELLVIGLRQRDGIFRGEFAQRMGIDPICYFKHLPEFIVKNHWLEVSEDNIRITNKGVLFFDTIAHHLLNSQRNS